MKSKFKVYQNGMSQALNVSMFKFPGGEISVKVDVPDFLPKYLVVNARILDSDGVMALAMLKDTLDRNFPEAQIVLELPYLPYARQDRVCNKGEALSIKVFANMVNAMEFKTVTVYDCHSDVGVALLDRCTNVGQEYIFDSFFFDISIRLRDSKDTTVLVSPDAGANKKVNALGLKYGFPVIRADKSRDVATGAITGTVVYYTDDLNGVTCIICDDICDGGRTFIELAKVLKAKGAESIILVVTHGIFSKGVDVVLDSGINRIITTDSCDVTESQFVEVVPC